MLWPPITVPSTVPSMDIWFLSAISLPLPPVMVVPEAILLLVILISLFVASPRSLSPPVIFETFVMLTFWPMVI